jgi:osmoprotectant transport system substrate-binding protein
VTAEVARREGLVTISDLGPHAPDMTFGGPAECVARDLCLEGLEERYGLSFRRFVPLDSGGPLTVSALRGGTADVALLFTTDPSFETDGFVLLRDDLSLQPAENVTPIVRDEVIARFGPEVVSALEGVSARLDTSELRGLNLAVLRGAELQAVARSWLMGISVPQ